MTHTRSSLSNLLFGQIHWRHAALYGLAQVAGAFAGVADAHDMFGEAVFFASQDARTGPLQWWSEFVATFGLLAVIVSCSRIRPTSTPFPVAAYIAAAYWFTSS